MDDMIQDQTDFPSDYKGAVVLVNHFTPKPGQMDAFIEAQIGEYKRLIGKVDGWRGNRLHLSVDNKTVVNYAVFESLAQYTAWRDSDGFAEHKEAIAPFVAKSEPGLYGEALYEAGTM